ncbi:hypothetical protein KKG05_08155, partial [bacterium]|nr:hypothetical protein [bacterium]
KLTARRSTIAGAIFILLFIVMDCYSDKVTAEPVSPDPAGILAIYPCGRVRRHQLGGNFVAITIHYNEQKNEYCSGNC